MAVDLSAEVSDDERRKIVGTIEQTVSIDHRRTAEASLAYELNALVEVGLRALSPGINDPYTAMSCIDRLADGLRILIDYPRRSRVTRDGQGNIRVVHRQYVFDDFCNIAFRPLIRAADDKPMVLEKIVSALAELARMTEDDTHHATIAGQLVVIRDTAQLADMIGSDREQLFAAVDAVFSDLSFNPAASCEGTS